MSDRESALATLDLDRDSLREITEKLADTEPGAAAVLEAMTTFLTTAEERFVEGRPRDLRRSEVAVMTSMAAEVTNQLGLILGWIDIGGWVTDADLIDPISDSLTALDEGLKEAVDNLNPHSTNGD